MRHQPSLVENSSCLDEPCLNFRCVAAEKLASYSLSILTNREQNLNWISIFAIKKVLMCFFITWKSYFMDSSAEMTPEVGISANHGFPHLHCLLAAPRILTFEVHVWLLWS